MVRGNRNLATAYFCTKLSSQILWERASNICGNLSPSEQYHPPGDADKKIVAETQTRGENSCI